MLPRLLSATEQITASCWTCFLSVKSEIAKPPSCSYLLCLFRGIGSFLPLWFKKKKKKKHKSFSHIFSTKPRKFYYTPFMVGAVVPITSVRSAVMQEPVDFFCTFSSFSDPICEMEGRFLQDYFYSSFFIKCIYEVRLKCTKWSSERPWKSHCLHWHLMNKLQSASRLLQ